MLSNHQPRPVRGFLLGTKMQKILAKAERRLAQIEIVARKLGGTALSITTEKTKTAASARRRLEYLRDLRRAMQV